MAANSTTKFLQLPEPAVPNVARISTMAQFFLYAFRHETAIDKIGAAQTILADLIAENTRTLHDAVQCAQSAGGDIGDYLLAEGPKLQEGH